MSVATSCRLPRTSKAETDSRTVDRLVAQFRQKVACTASSHTHESGVGIIVCARKRPLFDAERSRALLDVVTCSNPKVFIHEPKKRVDNTQTVEHTEYVFDHTFGEESSTESIYRSVVHPLVRSVVERGGVSTCFAYGQTGSGKTYTMTGIEEFAAQDIFAMLDAQGTGETVHVAFFEIAGDKLFDLLHEKTELFIREDERGEVHVRGLETIEVGTAEELLHWVQVGSEQRCTRATFKNEASSRTHAICQVTLHDPDTDEVRGKLSLVDLAGSERANDVVHHDMERQRETIQINKSLMALQECTRMRVLEMRDSTVHVPFRQSRLTMLLKESFTRDDVGTAIIVTLSPIEADANHTHCTCRFADRIKEKGAGSNGIDKNDPRTWSKKEVSDWIQSVIGRGRPGMQDRLFASVTGKQLSLLTVEQCQNYCSIDGAGRRVYEEFQKLVAAAKERHTSPPAMSKSKENRRRQSVVVCDASDIELKAKRSKAAPAAPPLLPSHRMADLSASFCGNSSADRSETTVERPQAPFAAVAVAALSASVREPERKHVSARRSLVPTQIQPPAHAADIVPMSVEKKMSHVSRRRSSVMPQPQPQITAQPQRQQQLPQPQPPPPLREEELDDPKPAPRRSSRLRHKQETKAPQQPLPPPPPPPPVAPAEEDDYDMVDEAPTVPAVPAHVPQPQPRPEFESPEFMEAFESLYSRWKAEVSDAVMDGHNYSRTVLGKNASAQAAADAPGSQSELQWQLRTSVLEIANERRSFTTMANKSLAHLALQLSSLYSTFIARESRAHGPEAAEQAWLAFFEDLRTGIPSWDTAQRLLLVSSLAVQHMRLFYISSSFLDVTPYAHALALKLQDSSERAFWATLGSNSRTAHHYIIGGTEFCDS